MSFVEIAKRPPRDQFFSPAHLAGITAEQFNTERRYWSGLRNLGGIAQIELADYMLDPTLQLVDLACNLAAQGVPKLAPREAKDVTAALPAMQRIAVGGLSLSYLLRTAFHTELEEVNYGANPLTALAVDTKSGLDEQTLQIFNVQYRLDRVAETFPGYTPDRARYYSDGTLVVTAFHPALPTAEFSEKFERESGAPFDVSNYVTLKPQLLASYVQMPPAASAESAV